MAAGLTQGAAGRAGMRPVRIALDGDVAPAHAALLVREDDQPFALVGRWAGGGAIAGGDPVRVAAADEDPLALLDELPPLATPEHPSTQFVGGGWFGWLGYRLGGRIEQLQPAPPARERRPAFALAYHDHVLRHDGERWWFEALWTDERAAALEGRLATLRGRLAAPPAPRPFRAGPFRTEPTPAGHARAVQACRERIAAGDLFQANLALRLRGPLEGDVADVFTRGAAALAPDRAAWVAGVASLSPELYLERRGRTVRSAPIKGTRPRGEGPAALAASSKDRAENVMIVDLVRNDLGRVCAYGSVTVDALAEPRPHAGVWHLVSEVRGTLREDVSDAALVAATFPPGSVTGAPKVAAMDVIAELESAERQVFTGAIGFASPAAGLELSVAIRTFEHDGEHLWLDVGGGVTAGSDPDAEAAEALAKATPLLAAVGAELERAEPPADAAPAPVRLGPRPLPRPDPAAGIFETILVRDGAPVDLDRHLARLAASLDALYGVAPAVPPLPELPARGRLRLLADASGHVVAEPAPAPTDAGAVTLAPVCLPGGLGAHKWRDRRLVAALEAAVAPAVPLLVDLDGFVLEATWATVVAELAGGALATPPLDGRILPGVGRARLLREREVAERPVHLGEVRGALLVNALRTVRARLDPAHTTHH